MNKDKILFGIIGCISLIIGGSLYVMGYLPYKIGKALIVLGWLLILTRLLTYKNKKNN